MGQSSSAYHRRRYLEKYRPAKLQAIEQLGGKCADCGFDDLSRLEVFDFDHLSNKVIKVSQLLRGYSKSRLDAELEKCEVVCANCHRTRTSQRALTRSIVLAN